MFNGILTPVTNKAELLGDVINLICRSVIADCRQSELCKGRLIMRCDLWLHNLEPLGNGFYIISLNLV